MGSPIAVALVLAACGAEHTSLPVPDAEDPPPDAPSIERCITDVPRQFRQLPQSVATERYLGAHNHDVIPWPRYTTSVDNLFGAGEHFQGIQRLGRHLLVTGGVKNGSNMSQLIVVEMGSRSTDGPWSLPSYGFDHVDPAAADRVAAVVDIDPIRWHAGGFQIWDHTAAVPLFGSDQTSEVRFFDVSDPVHPTSLATRIERTKIAYAVGLMRIDDGRYLAVVWDDVDLDFYRSLSADLGDGFEATPATVTTDAVTGGFQGGQCGVGCGTYQNLNFVRDCDGRMFLIGTRNTQKAAPSVPGDNLASLYEVGGAADAAPALSFVDRRTIECADLQCNFGAGAGVYVGDSDHLMLYATPHWLNDGNALYNFNEYSYP